MEKDKTAPHYKGDSPETLAAFEVYLNMGNDRSLAKVAKHLKLPLKTIENWSNRLEWRERVVQFQEEAAERAKEDMKQQFFRDAENVRNFKYTILDTLKKRFEVGHYCPECETPRLSVSEMINILNVCKTELGEPTNITKQTAPNPDNDPFSIILSRLFPAPPAPANANVEPKP